MVWQSEALGLQYSGIATNLGVDPATVCRTVTQFRQSGTVQIKEHPSPRAYNKLTTPLELMIVHLVLKRPGIYLHAIATELLDTTGASLSLSTICRFLKKIALLIKD
jgi:transposase